MKTDSKGFTLVEVLVSVLLTAVIVLMGFSFFIYQSRGSGTVAKEMVSDEEISLTLNLLKRDILHGQDGLNQNPELAVYVTDKNNKADGAYHELYINYGRFLSGHFSTVANVFKNFAYFTESPTRGQFDVPPPMVQTPTTLPLDAQAQQYQAAFLAHIGAAIIEPNPFSLGTITVSPVTGQASGSAGNRYCTFTVTDTSALPAGKYNLSPATVYEWKQVTAPTTGELVGVITRNGKNLLGGNSTLTVQDFRIRCLFVDADGITLKWTPPEGTETLGFSQRPPANLRLVEITVRYKHLDLASETRREQSVEIGKNARPGPRLTVLNAY
jgi:prepilin-type N-terminal cleavage/methylation domain-containing protein